MPDILDNFTEATTISLEDHTPDVGGVWTHRQGSFEVEGGTGFAVADNTPAIATMPTAFRDGTIVLDVNNINVPKGFGLVFRYRDINNYWYINCSSTSWLKLLKVIDGEITEVASDTSASTDITATLTLTFQGDTITADVSGNFGSELSVTHTSSELSDATIHGLYCSQDDPSGSADFNKITMTEVVTLIVAEPAHDPQPFLDDLTEKRGYFGGGTPFSALIVELDGGSLVEMTPFEPDATTFRGEYYYNTARNVLYKRVVNKTTLGEDTYKTGHWQKVSS